MQPCSVATLPSRTPDSTRLGIRVKVDPQHPRGKVQWSSKICPDDRLGGDPDVLLGGEAQPPGHPHDLVTLLLSGVQYEYSVLSPLQLEIIGIIYQ